MTDISQKERQSYALRQGWLAGGISILVFVLLYFVQPAAFLHPVAWWSSLLIYLFFMYRAVQPAAALTFRDNVRDPFLTFLLANGLFYLFYYIMLSYLAPDLQDLQWELLQASGQLPPDADKADYISTLPGIFLQYARSLVFGFGLAAAVTWAKRRQVIA